MRRVLLAGCVLTLLGACASEEIAPATMPTAGGSCADLAKLALPNATITKAETAGAGVAAPGAPGVDATKLPAFCRIAATLKPSPDSDIRIEVWMPAAGWNGKFLGTGNGGASGAIGYGALGDGVQRGYAVAATDTGHQGGAADYSFATGHPEKLTDNAWRAVHEMTVAGKALAKAYYTAGPRRSYWSACSTGGRQGLKEAQRFPADYDAIVAGAPARAWPGLPGLSLMMQLELADAAKGLPVSKLSLLKETFIKTCDASDGVTDRVVSEPGKCRFDPAVAQCSGDVGATCLSANEVAAAKRIYGGLRNPDGSVIFPGMMPGSEPGWAGLTQGFKIGESYFSRVVHAGDAAWSAAKFDVATDVPLARKVDPAMDASNPDISAFTGRGGKLILYHGTTDGLIPTQSTVDYYESVVAKAGKAKAAEHVRLFLMPGMDHCRGGEGPSNADFLGALEQWDEHGKAPETVVASKSLPGGLTRARPLCAYPKMAKYSGSGSSDDAANFSCVAP